jgi:hypothetical protein
VAFWNTARMLDLAGMSWSRHTAATISIGPRWADAGVGCFWLFAALAIAGALTARGRRTPRYVAAVPALLFLSVAFLAFETPRYRTGIDPFIVMLASVALLAGWDARPRAGALHDPITLQSSGSARALALAPARPDALQRRRLRRRAARAARRRFLP